MKVARLAAGAILSAALSLPTLAQDGAHIGTWELIARTSPEGVVDQNPHELMVITDAGIFMRLELPPDRPRVDKPDADLTPEELRARYRGVVAFHGTYSVEGEILRATILGHTNPNREGNMATRRMKVEGDILTVSSPTDPNFPAVNRYRRIRGQGSASPR